MTGGLPEHSSDRSIELECLRERKDRHWKFSGDTLLQISLDRFGSLSIASRQIECLTEIPLEYSQRLSVREMPRRSKILDQNALTGKEYRERVARKHQKVTMSPVSDVQDTNSANLFK